MSQFRVADTGDVAVRYLDSGGDDLGAPVVFVPGFTDVADDYVEILPVFGRRIVVVELRGHGRSTAPAGPFDSDALARDVGAVVGAVTAGPVHLMTFSRGTTYALSWALANRERVRSVSIGDYVPEEIELPDDVIFGLLAGRWRGTPVSDRDAAWARYRSLFPAAKLHEFVDSPHDIFRPERGRYPSLVREHVDAADAK